MDKKDPAETHQKRRLGFSHINKKHRKLKYPGNNGGNGGPGNFKPGRPQIAVDKEPVSHRIYQSCRGGDNKGNRGPGYFPKAGSDGGGKGHGNQGKRDDPQIPCSDSDNLLLGGVSYGHHRYHSAGDKPAEAEIQNRYQQRKNYLKPVSVLHSLLIAGAPELGHIDSPGLAAHVDNNYEDKVKLICHVYRGHAGIPQAGNHKVINEGYHAHDELLEHDWQSYGGGFPVKAQGAQKIRSHTVSIGLFLQKRPGCSKTVFKQLPLK
jgi:hypothetical protein